MSHKSHDDRSAIGLLPNLDQLSHSDPRIAAEFVSDELQAARDATASVVAIHIPVFKFAKAILWLLFLASIVANSGCARVGSITTRNGGISYVDATEGPDGNTQLSTGQIFSPAQALHNDNQWTLRSYANGGTVFTSNDGRGPLSEDAPALVTTISGLKPGAHYNIYAYFWSDHHNWHLQASVKPGPTDGSTASFSKDGTESSSVAPLAVATNFDSPTLTTEDNRKLYQANLGHSVADAYGQIRVWVDDYPNAPELNRTWYDGVGYSPASRFAMDRRTLATVLTLGAVSLGSLLCLIISIFRNRRRKPATDS
jgi:hypothetical protein